MDVLPLLILLFMHLSIAIQLLRIKHKLRHAALSPIAGHACAPRMTPPCFPPRKDADQRPCYTLTCWISDTIGSSSVPQKYYWISEQLTQQNKKTLQQRALHHTHFSHLLPPFLNICLSRGLNGYHIRMHIDIF